MTTEKQTAQPQKEEYPSSGYPGTNYEHPEENRRFATIQLENSTMHKVPGTMWSFEIAKVLREYADAVENGRTGNNATGIFDSENGTRMVILTGTWNGAKCQIPGRFVRQENLHFPSLP